MLYVSDGRSSGSGLTVKKIYTQNNESQRLYTIATTSSVKVSFNAYFHRNRRLLGNKRNRGFVLGYIAYGDRGMYYYFNFIDLFFKNILNFLKRIIIGENESRSKGN